MGPVVKDGRLADPGCDVGADGAAALFLSYGGVLGRSL